MQSTTVYTALQIIATKTERYVSCGAFIAQCDIIAKCVSFNRTPIRPLTEIYEVAAIANILTVQLLTVWSPEGEEEEEEEESLSCWMSLYCRANCRHPGGSLFRLFLNRSFTKSTTLLPHTGTPSFINSPRSVHATSFLDDPSTVWL